MIIESGSSTAEILERGAYVRSLSIDGSPLLKQTSDDSMTHGGCAVLIPFAGRIRGATYVYDGKTYSLPRNDGDNAIHGFLKDRDLLLKKKTASSVTLEASIAQTGYPTTLRVRIDYQIFSRGFRVDCQVTNVGESRAPLSVGFHPYFMGKNWEIEHECKIQKLQTSDGVFPNGKIDPSAFGTIGQGNHEKFDDCFQFPCNAQLRTDSHSLTIRKKNMPFVMVYNGEWAEGESLAFEPYTSAPDAFNNGIGLINLLPNESHECGFEVQLVE